MHSKFYSPAIRAEIGCTTPAVGICHASNLDNFTPFGREWNTPSSAEISSDMGSVMSFGTTNSLQKFIEEWVPSPEASISPSKARLPMQDDHDMSEDDAHAMAQTPDPKSYRQSFATTGSHGDTFEFAHTKQQLTCVMSEEDGGKKEPDLFDRDRIPLNLQNLNSPTLSGRVPKLVKRYGDPATEDEIDASVMETQDDTGFADDSDFTVSAAKRKAIVKPDNRNKKPKKKRKVEVQPPRFSHTLLSAGPTKVTVPHVTMTAAGPEPAIEIDSGLRPSEMPAPMRKAHASKRSNTNAMEYRSKEKDRKVANNRKRIVDAMLERVMSQKSCAQHLTENCVIEFKDGTRDKTVKKMKKDQFIEHNAKLATLLLHGDDARSNLSGFSVIVGESSQGCPKKQPKVYMETGGVEGTVKCALSRGPMTLKEPVFFTLKLEHITGRDWKSMKSKGEIFIPRIEHITIHSTAELEYLSGMEVNTSTAIYH